MSSIDLDNPKHIFGPTNNTFDKESDETISIQNSHKRIWKITSINTDSNYLDTDKLKTITLNPGGENIYLRRSKKKSEWTIEEENLIFQLHKENGNLWTEIAKFIPGKHHNEIKNYFYCKVRKLIRMLVGKVINEEIREKTMNLSQTLYLLDFIKSEYLNNKSSEKCKDRYLNYIIKNYSLNAKKVEDYKKMIIAAVSENSKNEPVVTEKKLFFKSSTCIVSDLNSENKKTSENTSSIFIQRLPLPRNFFNPKFQIQPLEQPNYDLFLFPYPSHPCISRPILKGLSIKDLA